LAELQRTTSRPPQGETALRSLDLSEVQASVLAPGRWAAALLHALAREEAAGRRPPRLTEPGLATWTRFRGRLTSTDLLALLFEDAAVIHPIPFSPAALGEALGLQELSRLIVDGWLEAIPKLALQAPSPDYIFEQAQLLGLPRRLARSELHVVKAHQKVLELPGTGGQLAHHLVLTYPELTLQENCVIAASSWQELTLAGIVGLDLGAPHTNFIFRAGVEELRNPEHPLRQRPFDFVVGLHPDKGGLLRAEDQLSIWYPTARLILV